MQIDAVKFKTESLHLLEKLLRIAYPDITERKKIEEDLQQGIMAAYGTIERPNEHSVFVTVLAITQNGRILREVVDESVSPISAATPLVDAIIAEVRKPNPKEY